MSSCILVDNDPWGRPYKIVMKKLKSSKSLSLTCPELLNSEVTSLFTQQPEFNIQIPRAVSEDIPAITVDELIKACNKDGDTKSPDPVCQMLSSKQLSRGDLSFSLRSATPASVRGFFRRVGSNSGWCCRRKAINLLTNRHFIGQSVYWTQ